LQEVSARRYIEHLQLHEDLDICGKDSCFAAVVRQVQLQE